MKLITAIRDWFSKKPAPVDGPHLNRKQRRAIAFASTAEQRMRLERTAIRIAKRKQKRGVTGSDNGAKALRAYRVGLERGTQYLVVRVRQAHAIGIAEGKKSQLPRPLRFLVRA